MARGGTLFLDEIDSLSLAIQGKLLRLVQEQTFRPLGSDQFCDADLRIVAATNCDLATLVQQKRFRSDLFFRLDVLRVHLPALRERRSDVALLARHFVAEICAKDSIPHKTLTPAAIRKIESHQWPGNIRELYHAVHRAALSARGNEIVPVHISLGDERNAAESSDGSYEIVGQAEDGPSAVPLIMQTPADVVLMDVRLPGMFGVDVLKKIREQDCTRPIILVTTFDDDDMFFRAIQAGANRFIRKDSTLSDLTACIEKVIAGERVFRPSVTHGTRMAIEALQPNFESSELPEPLTKRREKSWH